MRKPVIIGNWKMNNNFSDLLDFTEEVNGKFHDLNDVEIGICIPSVFLMVADKTGPLKIGAQNVYYEKSGAFTGEVSVSQIKDCLVSYCIIGHSERRTIFCEDDMIVNKKIKAVIAENIVPIVCFGENLDEYEQGISKEVVKRQLVNSLIGIDSIENFIFAYEPIWAIGTGKTATSEYANMMCKYTREVLTELYGDATSIRIQYGGSVKPNNIKELLSMSDIDGALVGGASVKAEDFIKLVSESL